jgi:hypothetical protein
MSMGGLQGLDNVLTRLASNFDPPNLCLIRSWDYTCEPPYVNSLCNYFIKNFCVYVQENWPVVLLFFVISLNASKDEFGGIYSLSIL